MSARLGQFGAEAAARHYFGRSARELSAEQAAGLAATLPHPLTSNPVLRPARMAWRQQLILQRMSGKGPIETVPLEPPGELPVPELALPELYLGEPQVRFELQPPPDTAVTPQPGTDTASPPMDSIGQ